MKNSDFYSIPMITHSNPDAYEVFWARAIASFFLIDHSMLNRMSDEHSNFVFLNLHKANDNAVSINLNNQYSNARK